MQAVLFWLAALAGHAALWVEVVNRSHGYGWPRKLVHALTALCGLVLLGAPLGALWLYRRGSLADSAPLAWYAYACLAALALLGGQRIAQRWDPRRCRQNRLTGLDTVDLAKRLGDAATGPPLVGRLAALPGNQLLQLHVEHRTLPIERLPEACEGLRVAHLTDLHMSGRLGLDYFRAVCEEVNRWGPDLVCVTGDIVEETPQLEWIDPTLGTLRPRLGSHFILGNHDAKIDHEAMRQRLESAGLTDACQGLFRYGPEAGGLVVCGDERPWFHHEPPLDGTEPLVLCLAHTPDRFGWAIDRGVDLVLAGHNHGGQVCFPLIGPLLCPSRHGVRYAAGTFRHGRTVMHVSRGTGSLFPLRYACPPELALLTLVSG